MSNILNDTIVAVITPAGVGGVAIVRAAGPRAIELSSARFVGADLADVASHIVHHGFYRTVDGVEIDEVLANVFRAPRSYTGDDVVEVSCHGSPAIASAIVDDLVAAGARLARPGEFTERAFLNGRIDLAQAEAVADLVAAESTAAARAAERQLKGEIGDSIRNIVARLVEAAGLLELELDFVEEGIELLDKTGLTKLLETSVQEIEQLVKSYRRGRLVKHGITVAIVGAPNVGKSTLLNAIAGERRAIVSPTPGTTRDVVETAITHKGIRLEFWDTAGIRSDAGDIEEIGIEMAMERAGRADVVLIVHDAAESDSWPAGALTGDGIQLHVLNKSDLLERAKLERALHTLPSGARTLSALKGTGVDELLDAILSMCIGETVDSTSPMITNHRHLACLEKALTCTRQAMEIATSASQEFTSAEIRRAISALGEITGEVTSSDILERIFERFCIGK